MSVRMFEGASNVRIGKSSVNNYGGDYHDNRTTYKGNASNNTRTYHQEGAGTIYNGDISGNINTFNGGSHEHNSGPAQKQGRRSRKARAPTPPSSSDDSDDDSDPNNFPSQRNRHRQEPPQQYSPPGTAGYAQRPSNDYRADGGNYYGGATVNLAPVNNVGRVENGNFNVNHGNIVQNRGDPPPARNRQNNPFLPNGGYGYDQRLAADNNASAPTLGQYQQGGPPQHLPHSRTDPPRPQPQQSQRQRQEPYQSPAQPPPEEFAASEPDLAHYMQSASNHRRRTDPPRPQPQESQRQQPYPHSSATSRQPSSSDADYRDTDASVAALASQAQQMSLRDQRPSTNQPHPLFSQPQSSPPLQVTSSNSSDSLDSQVLETLHDSPILAKVQEKRKKRKILDILRRKKNEV